MSNNRALSIFMGISGALLFAVPLHTWFQTPEMPLMFAVQVFGMQWIVAASFAALALRFWRE